MMVKLSFTLIFSLAIGLGIGQNNVRSNSLWQIENLANGAKGTFSLIVMNDESCTLSLTTVDNTYQSKDCIIGKSTVTDYDGNLYQLDFKSTNNFGVILTLTNKKEIVEYRSVRDKSNEFSTEPSIAPTPPETPKVVVAKAPILEVKKVPQEDVKIEEVEEITSSNTKKSKKKNAEEIKPIESSSNRQVVYTPDFVNNCKKVYGIVVFDVTISKTGRVIASKINLGESTNPTSCLVSTAIEVLGDMRWEAIVGNYEEDLSVTFNFVKQ